MTIQSFADCQALAATRKCKLANNTYLGCNEDGSYGVRLFATQVVVYYADGRVVLDSRGWRTPTTKERMNRFSPLGVHSERGVWYVTAPNHQTPRYPFADGVTYHTEFDGFTGLGDGPREQQKLRKRADKFAKAYMVAFEAGEVAAPSTKDCWGCLMVAWDGSQPIGGPDHMQSHLDESYYVPSMLVHASERFSVSRMATWVLHAGFGTLRGEEDDSPISLGDLGSMKDIGLEQLGKALRRHVCCELGLPA